jgi:hypothetical protein
VPEFAKGGIVIGGESDLIVGAAAINESGCLCTYIIPAAHHSKRSIAILKEIQRATEEASATIREIADNA